MKNLLIFTRRSFILNRLLKAKHKVQENPNGNTLNTTNIPLTNEFKDTFERKISINSPSLSLNKQSLKLNKTLNQSFYENKCNYNLVKTASAAFSTNISIDELDQKKKADNNKKANKKLKEEEKLEQEETIKSIKTINSELEQELKIAKTIQKIENSSAEHLADKENKSEKINKMIYLKKLNPELKVVIAKKVKKIHPNISQKSLYPLMQFRELPNNGELYPTDPFRDLLHERTGDQFNNNNHNSHKNENFLFSKIQNENRRIVFNKSLEKAGKMQKKDDLSAFKDEYDGEFRNEEFSEHKKAIENVYSLRKEFTIERFNEVLNYISKNPIDDGLILSKIEEIFVERLREIDCSSKSELVFIMGKALQKKKIKFNENSWFLIFKDFQGLMDLSILTFKDFYYYIIAFETIKSIVFAARPKFLNEFERYISYDSLNMINTGRVKLMDRDDIILLLSLIHVKIVAINSLSDAVWISLNELMLKNSSKVNINTLVVFLTLVINLSEISPVKAHVTLHDAISETAKFINSVFTNFEFLEEHEKMKLIKFSDTLFNFYLIFIHSHNHSANVYKNSDEPGSRNKFDFILSNEGFLIKNLIAIYTQKVKLQINFDFFEELRILIFLSKELKYFDQEFWGYCAKSVKSFLKNDFMRKISDILPKRLGNATSSAKARATAVEVEEMSKLFYYGVIIEVFSTVGYHDQEFWDCIFDKFDEIVPNSKKDPLILLQFISLHCKKLYKNRKFDKIYERLVNKFSPEFKRIFINREILDFLIGVNFHHMEFDREKNNKLILNLINPLYPFRPLDNKPSENRIVLTNDDKDNNINHNKIYKQNEENLVKSVNVNETISSLKKDGETTPENTLTTTVDIEGKEISEAFEKDDLESLVDKSSDPLISREEAKEKEPNNILLLITYLNLLWSKSLFEEEVN